MRTLHYILLACMSVCLAAACTQQKEIEQKNAEQEHKETFETMTQPLKVPLIKRDGTETGFIEVYESAAEGLDIRVSAHDLPPGMLAFHIHETGVCKKPDFESAGAHFNPNVMFSNGSPLRFSFQFRQRRGALNLSFLS